MYRARLPAIKSAIVQNTFRGAENRKIKRVKEHSKRLENCSQVCSADAVFFLRETGSRFLQREELCLSICFMNFRRANIKCKEQNKTGNLMFAYHYIYIIAYTHTCKMI